MEVARKINLPPTIQTTVGYSPEFSKPPNYKDTRPIFLGGQYTSKVKGVSEVKDYLNKQKEWYRSTKNQDTSNKTLLPRDISNDTAERAERAEKPVKGTYDVNSYFAQKMKMKNSIERAFKQQAKQYQ